MYELSDIFFDNLWNRQKKARSEFAFFTASRSIFGQLKAAKLVAAIRRVSEISRRRQKFLSSAPGGHPAVRTDHRGKTQLSLRRDGMTFYEEADAAEIGLTYCQQFAFTARPIWQIIPPVTVRGVP